MPVREFGSRSPHRAYRARQAAYAVILDRRGRIACVRTGGDHFLPGGGLAAGESPIQALGRELGEECAREALVLGEIGRATQFFTTRSGEAIELSATFFRASFGSELPGSPQHELVWLPAAEARAVMFHESHRWAIERALRQRDGLP